MPRSALPAFSLVVGLTLSTALGAQAMSGLYTLGGPAGPRNFGSFAEATYQLSRRGVDGPVTIDSVFAPPSRH